MITIIRRSRLEWLRKELELTKQALEQAIATAVSERARADTAEAALKKARAAADYAEGRSDARAAQGRLN